MRRPRTLLAAAAVVTVAGWAALPAQPADLPLPAASPPGARPSRDWNLRQTPVVDVVKRVRGAVVNIHSERNAHADEATPLTGTQNRINGMGTGIIVDQRGYIITNQHVVEDVNVIRVRLHDGTAANARVLARDPETDLALLKIDVNRTLPTMPLGTASDLEVGETVIAIGNAYGYEHTVTVGVVSATKRDVNLNKEMSYKALIQTDASINPGNSGGPLLNVYGELVGVNVAIRAGAQGIGFAIPVDTMARVSADLMGPRRRGGASHGMGLRDDVRRAADEALVRVAVVERLDANGPAAKAGLKKGDVVAKVGDATVGCGLDLERALLDNSAGDKVAVVFRRDGSEQKAELVLEGGKGLGTDPGPAGLAWRKLGMRLQGVGAETVSRTNQQLHGGLYVSELRADSAAAKAGIQKGDVLVGLHNWEMLTQDNVAYVLTHADLATFLPLKFYIVRGNQVHRGYINQLD